MKRVKNKNGIKLYWEKSKDLNKINIFDSNKNYFNDLYYDEYDNDNGLEDIKAIINTLENTTLENMCNFFNATLFETIEELIHDANLYDFDENTAVQNEYVNTFKVGYTTYYTWIN